MNAAAAGFLRGGLPRGAGLRIAGSGGHFLRGAAARARLGSSRASGIEGIWVCLDRSHGLLIGRRTSNNMTRLVRIGIIAAVVGVIADVRILDTGGFVKRIPAVLAGYEAKEDTCDGEKASRGDQVHEGFEDELF